MVTRYTFMVVLVLFSTTSINSQTLCDTTEALLRTAFHATVDTLLPVVANMNATIQDTIQKALNVSKASQLEIVNICAAQNVNIQTCIDADTQCMNNVVVETTNPCLDQIGDTVDGILDAYKALENAINVQCCALLPNLIKCAQIPGNITALTTSATQQINQLSSGLGACLIGYSTTLTSNLLGCTTELEACAGESCNL